MVYLPWAFTSSVGPFYQPWNPYISLKRDDTFNGNVINLLVEKYS